MEVAYSGQANCQPNNRHIGPATIRKPPERQSAPVAQPHSDKQSSQGNGEQHSLKEPALEFFNVKLTDILIAVFTIVLAWKTSGLFKETAGLRTAADQQALDMKAAIEASRESATAATRQAETAERSLTHLERPYIFVFGVNRIEEDEDGDFFIRYSVANYGKTPAILDSVKTSIFHTMRGEILNAASVPDSHPLSVSPIIQSGEIRNDLIEYVGQHLYRGAEHAFTSPSGDFVNIPIFNIPTNESVMFRIWVQYHGPLSGPHQTGAMWRHMGDGLFAIRGDSQNYQY